jgi:predicted acylesterase/phospholipase RssA
MAEHTRGPVIAVDVFPYQRPKDAGEGRRRKGLIERLKRLKPSSATGPWLFEVLMHATLVGSQHTTKQSLADHPPALYLVPELTTIRLLEWGAYEALFQAGYTATKRAIEEGAFPRRLWEGRIEDAAS